MPVLICCLHSAKEGNQMQKLYSQTCLLQTFNTAPFFTISSCFLMHTMLLLWENSGSRSISVSSFSSLSFSFSTYSFSWRCSYKEEELIAVASMPKIDLSYSHSDNCQIMPTESVGYAWVPGCSAGNCFCLELQRIWMRMPEEEENTKEGVIFFLQAWPVMWTSVIPFP